MKAAAATTVEPPTSPEAYPRWPHRLAVLLVCATYPMIWIGALVTTTRAGMAVPDWPSTYGYNLLLYPWETWFFGPWDLFIEHGHRLFGVLVGLLTIGLCLGLWLWDERGWVRVLGLVALVLVIAQGVLGGLRVVFDEVRLAQLHGCAAQFFFAFTVAMAVFTSPWWRRGGISAATTGGLPRIALLTTLLVYLQIVLGSFLRHVHPTMHHESFRIVVVFHVVLAAIVVAQGFLLGVSVWRSRVRLGMSWLAALLVTLTLAQVAVGIATWLWKYALPFEALAGWAPLNGWLNTAGSMSESIMATAHVAVGALILATALTIALRSLRIAQLARQMPTPLAGATGAVA